MRRKIPSFGFCERERDILFAFMQKPDFDQSQYTIEQLKLVNGSIFEPAVAIPATDCEIVVTASPSGNLPS